MKPIIAIVLIAAAVGWFRYGRWLELQRDAATLNATSLPTRPVSGWNVRGGREAAEIPVTLERDLLRFLELDATGIRGVERDKLSTSLADEFLCLDHASICRLIARLEGDASVPAEMRAKVMDACIAALSEVNPEEAMRLVASHPDAELNALILGQTFARWAARRPAGALRWYDEMEKKGLPIVRDGKLLLYVVPEQARIDPAGALERALSHESMLTLENSRYLGQVVGRDQMFAVDEHRSFMVALEHVSKKHPSSGLLKSVREGYIRQLTGCLSEFPIEDAIMLIETGFRPDEKLAAAKEVGDSFLMGPKEEMDRWAGWIAKAEAPADSEHPLIRLINVWSFFDAEAAGRWIAKEPESPLKDACLAELPDKLWDTEALKHVSERQKSNGEGESGAARD